MGVRDDRTVAAGVPVNQKPASPPLPVPDRLVVDEAMWRYPSGTLAGAGYGHLRVWTTSPAGHLAIVSEVGLGASVTNSAEHIWAELIDRFGRPLVLLEHWPAGEGLDREDTLDQVHIAPGLHPWRRIWPTDPDHPEHDLSERWMREHGHRLLAETRPA